MTGIEPASLVWKTMTLPLSYIRIALRWPSRTRTYNLPVNSRALTAN